MDQVFQFIGEYVVLVGLSVTSAFAIFKLVGIKWLEAKFVERLESYKHEQRNRDSTRGLRPTTKSNS